MKKRFLTFLFIICYLLALTTFSFSYKLVRVVFVISSAYPSYVNIYAKSLRGSLTKALIYPNRVQSQPIFLPAGVYKVTAEYNGQVIGIKKLIIRNAGTVFLNVKKYKEDSSNENVDNNSNNLSSGFNNQNTSQSYNSYNNRSNTYNFPYKKGFIVVDLNTKPSNCLVSLKLIRVLDKRALSYSFDRQYSFETPKKIQIPKGDYYVVIKKSGYEVVSRPIRLTENRKYFLKLKAYVNVNIENSDGFVLYLNKRLLQNGMRVLEGEYNLQILKNSIPVYAGKIKITPEHNIIDVKDFVVHLHVQNAAKNTIIFYNKDKDFKIQVITSTYDAIIPVGKYVVKVINSSNSLLFKKIITIKKDYNFSIDSFFAKLKVVNIPSNAYLKIIAKGSNKAFIIKQDGHLNLNKGSYFFSIFLDNKKVYTDNLDIKEDTNLNLSNYLFKVSIDNSFSTENIKIKLTKGNLAYFIDNNKPIMLAKGSYLLKVVYLNKVIYKKKIDIIQDTDIKVSEFLSYVQIDNPLYLTVKLRGIEKKNKGFTYKLNASQVNIVVPKGKYVLYLYQGKILVEKVKLDINKDNFNIQLDKYVSKLIFLNKSNYNIYIKKKDFSDKVKTDILYLPQDSYSIYIKDSKDEVLLTKFNLLLDKPLVRLDISKFITKTTKKSENALNKNKVDNQNKLKNQNQTNKIKQSQGQKKSNKNMPQKKGKSKFLVLGIIFVVTAIILLILLLYFNKNNFTNTLYSSGSLKSKSLVKDSALADLSDVLLKGKYKIVEKIASGGMGDIFLAIHIKKNIKVAVKMLHRDYMQDEEFLKRFKREAEIGKILYHPQIVRIYDSGLLEDIPYIIMEYINGKTLRELLKERKRFTSLDAVNIVMQIAEALDYAHQKGVIHRDLKPENIMMIDSKEVKVADFGIAKINSSKVTTNITAAGTYLGTPVYMSPEQLLDKPIDGRTDIYSLGIIFYELLKGEPPFMGSNAFSIINAHLSSPVPKLRDLQSNIKIDLELEKIIMKMLEKDPEDRYKNAEELLIVLREYLNKFM